MWGGHSCLPTRTTLPLRDATPKTRPASPVAQYVHSIALVRQKRLRSSLSKYSINQSFTVIPSIGSLAAIPLCNLPNRAVGCHLTISFGYTAVMPIEAPKKKRSLLPTLTVLFCFSYVLMTLLIVQQGSVIQSQGNLIKDLMRDSKELWAAKGKAIEDQQMSQAQSKNRAHAPASKTPSSQMPSTPSTQVPSVQVPSTQVPPTQSPSNQVPQSHTQNHAGKIAKPQPQAPPVPASDLVDQRRSLTTI